jgi:Flp pilus assembly protein TadB
MNWTRDRWLILGLLLIVVGYVVLAMDVQATIAATLLVAGYCVLVPAYLWTRYRRDLGE